MKSKRRLTYRSMLWNCLPRIVYVFFSTHSMLSYDSLIYSKCQISNIKWFTLWTLTKSRRNRIFIINDHDAKRWHTESESNRYRLCVLNLTQYPLVFLQVILGAVAVTVTEKYATEVNFTYPISVQSYGMLISRPKELSRLYLFTAPFTIDVSFSFSIV